MFRSFTTSVRPVIHTVESHIVEFEGRVNAAKLH